MDDLTFWLEETTRWKLQLEKGLIANAAGDWLDGVFADLVNDPMDMDILDLISKVCMLRSDLNHTIFGKGMSEQDHQRSVIFPALADQVQGTPFFGLAF